MTAIVLATIGLAVAGIVALWMSRGGALDPGPAPARGVIDGSTTLAESLAEPISEAIATSQPQPLASVMVEIQGAVATPGIYSFPGDARVFDALQKAGGALDSAEIRDINIAAVLLDGSVLSIPYRQQNARVAMPGAADLNPPAYTRSGWAESSEEKARPGSTPTSGATVGAPSRVNINTATQAELETLPGVGEKTAEKIMRFRETQPFTQVDDLQYVQGIGEKRLETLRPHVTVE
jgi:competence protein ComEA